MKKYVITYKTKKGTGTVRAEKGLFLPSYWSMVRYCIIEIAVEYSVDPDEVEITSVKRVW